MEAEHSQRRSERTKIKFETDVEPWTAPKSFLEPASALGLTFEEGDLERLGRFLALLMRANEIVNLTASADAEVQWERHVLDPLTLLPLLAEQDVGSSVIDVGSGGGAPGLPLAISMPALRFSLLDATAKKAEFLRVACQALGLDSTSVVEDRAESLGRRGGAGRERFDAAICRALGRLNVACELVLPLVRVGGRALFVKGHQAREELEEAQRAIEVLGGALAGLVETPTSRVVVIEKVRRTPGSYPRRPGVPKKEPL